MSLRSQIRSRLRSRRCRARFLTVGAALVCGSTVAACSASPAPVQPTAPASTPSAYVGPGPAPVIQPLSERCTGVTVPTGTEQRVLGTADGSQISTAWLGSGQTAAILLHQTDSDGVCGVLFLAGYLARQHVRVVAIDMCGYSPSLCQPAASADPVVQIKVVSDALRAEGVRRITLVGASMGGSVALTAGAQVQADALVDLSGPADFNTSHLSEDAPTVTMPVLIAFGRTTDPSDLTAVQAALPAMPTAQKKLLTYPSGHGVELLHRQDGDQLTPLAGRVLDWVRGP